MKTDFNVCGLLGMIFALVGLLIFPFWFGLAGIILGCFGIYNANTYFQSRGMAITGLVVGIVDIIWCTIVMII